MEGHTFLSSDNISNRKNLFLLEVMIKKVEIDADLLLKSFTFDADKIPIVDVLAKVQFSSFYSLDIDSYGFLERGLIRNRSMEGISKTTVDLEKAPLINSTSADSIPITQGGKSCLFPMSTSQLVNELQSCPLYIDLFTKDATAIFLGKTKVHLGSNFVDVVESSPSCTDLPISAFMRSTLPMTSVFGEPSGHVEVYIRLSCFGKSILSDFSFVHSERERCFQGGGRMSCK